MIVAAMLIANTSLAAEKIDPDKQAGAYLVSLSKWSLDPELWLKECNKLDPTGATSRQQIYDSWALTNKELLSRIDELRHTAGDELFPSLKAKGADPSEALRAKATMDVSMIFSFTEKSKKVALCSNYAALPPLGSVNSSNMTKAIAYIDDWLASRTKKN
jgi:hypothetical protein